MNEKEKQQLIQKLSFNLCRSFSQQGLEVDEYNRLIKDVHSIIKPGGRFTVEGVNTKLSLMGWPREIMSDYNFEIIVNLLEVELNYTIKTIPYSKISNYHTSPEAI